MTRFNDALTDNVVEELTKLSLGRQRDCADSALSARA